MDVFDQSLPSGIWQMAFQSDLYSVHSLVTLLPGD
jgi:hypothetical protein